MLESFGPMNEVIINSTRYLEARDIGAMVTYLKSLPAVPSARQLRRALRSWAGAELSIIFTVVPATFLPVKGTLIWLLVWIAAVWLCRMKILLR